ncbi:hypothetical protein [Roseateles sp. LKC17W]|uniref:Methyltransferase domain-containing protein n=1 Tax=Pelomonas margarita TaxID=3299031 RepID=A0ABW7FDL3_9BURK
MNAPHENVARLSPWLRNMAGAADVLRGKLVNDVDSDTCRLLWWGVHSELLGNLGVLEDIDVVVVDADSRRLRRSLNGAAPGAQKLRLLDLADLRRDAAGVEAVLNGSVARDLDGYLALQERLAQRFEQAPAVASGSVDYIVQDFALNRVVAVDEARLLQEAMRCLAPKGRLLSVVLVADELVAEPVVLREGPQGPAMRLPTERELLAAFENAGFHGICVHWADADNPAALERIGAVEVRACVIEAFKGKRGPCYELGQAVIYGGPWREVKDDDGHAYPRGERVAVCAKTFDLLMRAPYQGQFTGLRSVNEPPLDQARLFDCNTPTLRAPGVTKGTLPFDGAQAPSQLCAPGGGCC